MSLSAQVIRALLLTCWPWAWVPRWRTGGWRACQRTAVTEQIRVGDADVGDPSASTVTAASRQSLVTWCWESDT